MKNLVFSIVIICVKLIAIRSERESAGCQPFAESVTLQDCEEGSSYNCTDKQAVAFELPAEVHFQLDKLYCIETHSPSDPHEEEIPGPFWIMVLSAVTRTFTLPLTLLVLVLYMYTPGLRTHQDKLLKQHLYAYIISQNLYLYLAYALAFKDLDHFLINIVVLIADIANIVSSIWVQIMVLDLWRTQRYKTSKTLEKGILKSYKWYVWLFTIYEINLMSTESYHRCLPTANMKYEHLNYYKTAANETFFPHILLIWTISSILRDSSFSQIRWQPLLGFTVIISTVQFIFNCIEFFGAGYGVVDDIVDIIHTSAIFYYYIYSRNKVLKNLASNRVFQVSWPDTWKTLPDQEDHEETDVELHQEPTDQQNLVE